MQDILPPTILLFIAMGAAMFFIAITYLRWTGSSLKQFTMPRGATSIGLLVFLFTGMALGIFLVLALYTGDLGIPGGLVNDFVFDNPIFLVFTISFVFAFMLMLSYVYIYRGGA